MLLTCEQCHTTYALDDALVPASGAPVQCTRCSHVFFARREQRPGPNPHLPRRNVMVFGAAIPRGAQLVTCEGCGTAFVLNHPLPAGGAAVQCTRCTRVFWANAPGPVSAPAGRPNDDVIPYLTPPLPDEPAESYRSAEGRVIFGMALPPEPVASADPMLDSLYRQVWAAPNADAPRHVLADYLSERGDLRGEFIQIQLTEPDGPTGLAKGRARELRRSFPDWLPAGVDAKSAVFRRGFLEECEWTGPTDFTHREWRTVARLDCAGAPGVATGKLFTAAQLPALKELHGVPARVFTALDDGQTRGRLEVLRTLGVATRLFQLHGDAIMRLPALHTLDLERSTVDAAGLRVLCALLARRNTLSHLRTPVRRLCLDLRRDGPGLREAHELVTQMVPGLTLELYPRGRADPWLALGHDGVRVCRWAGRGDASVRFHLHAVARREGFSPRYVVVEGTDP